MVVSIISVSESAVVQILRGGHAKSAHNQVSDEQKLKRCACFVIRRRAKNLRVESERKSSGFRDYQYRYWM